MSTRAELKAALVTGQTITQAKLHDVIDSLAHLSEDELATAASVAATLAGYALTTRKLDDFGTPDDNTDLNATTTRHGLLPKLSGVSTEFFNGVGGFSTPASGSSGMAAVADTTALAALTPTNGDSAYVKNVYEQGVFVFSTANLSTQVTADPNKGLYVAPSSDTSGASGAWVRRVENATYDLDWWLRGDSTLVEGASNIALKLIPTFSDILVPNRTMTIQRAAAGTVNAGSSSFFGGIIGGIYVDKEGQRLIGKGSGSKFDCEGRAMCAVMLRASRTRGISFKAGNCSGQLETAESAGVQICPSNFVHSTTGTGNGADISDIKVIDCEFYDCDSGVTVSPEREFKASEPPYYLYRVSNVLVTGCKITGCRRQGVEFFDCFNCVAEGNTFEGGDQGSYTYARFVRCVGLRGGKIINNFAKGFTDVGTTGYLGIAIEEGAWYGEPWTYQMPDDILIEGNHLSGFGCHIQIEQSQGIVTIGPNIFENSSHAEGSICIRINSQGINNPAGNATNETNKNYVSRIVVKGLTSIGQAYFIYWAGTVYSANISDCHFVSNGNAGATAIFLDLPSTHPLERVEEAVIENNTFYTNPASTVAPITIAGLKATNQIFIDGNNITPNSSGALIAHTGLGTVSQLDNYSNVPLTGDLWTRKFNPQAPNNFGEPNV